MHLRLSDAEHRLIEIAAARAGLSAGAYSARAAVAVARDEITPIPVDERERLQALADARVALNRIGNNLNQVAHVLNSGGDQTPEQIRAVIERVARVVGQVDAATIAMLDR